MDRYRPIVIIACLLALLPGLAAATSFVMVADEGLVDGAAVIAQVTVESVEPAPIPGPPSTDYFIQVERMLKGYVTGSTVVLRVPGGIGPDGVGLKIWGVPEFRQGERLLVFMAPREDGTYGILHLMLGAFFEVEAGGSRVAVRALPELPDDGLSQFGNEPLRDYLGFVNWVTDRVGGLRRPIDYYLDPARVDGRPALAQGRLLEDRCTQLNFRWFEFDQGDAVRWSYDGSGLDGRGAGRSAFVRARRLWNRLSEGSVRLSNGGTRGTRRSGTGLSGPDGLNLVSFGDDSDDIAGAFSCQSGGIVALTAIWFENGRGQSCERVGAGRKGEYNGREHLAILGADILVNDGAACLLANDSLLATQVFAHELGHSLGLSHGSDGRTVMSGDLSDALDLDDLDDLDVHAAKNVESLSELYRAPR